MHLINKLALYCFLIANLFIKFTLPCWNCIQIHFSVETFKMNLTSWIHSDVFYWHVHFVYIFKTSAYLKSWLFLSTFSIAFSDIADNNSLHAMFGEFLFTWSCFISLMVVSRPTDKVFVQKASPFASQGLTFKSFSSLFHHFSPYTRLQNLHK